MLNLPQFCTISRGRKLNKTAIKEKVVSFLLVLHFMSMEMLQLNLQKGYYQPHIWLAKLAQKQP